MQGGAGRGWQRYPRPTERWCALVCAGCATDNEPGRKFCRACGRRLAVACPACQAPNAADDRFCGECGEDLTQATDLPEAARDTSGTEAATPARAARHSLAWIVVAVGVVCLVIVGGALSFRSRSRGRARRE